MIRTATRAERGTPGADFDRVRAWALANLPALVAEAGVQLNRAGRAPCPLHGGDGLNFAVTAGEGWHCFSACAGGGDGVDFVRRMHYPHLAEREGRLGALRELAPRAGVCLEDRGRSPRRDGPRAPAVRPRLVSVAPVAPVVWSARSSADRAAAAAEWHRLTRQGACGAVGDFPAPATIYTALREALPLHAAARDYLAGRGLDPDAAAALGVRSVVDWRALADVLEALDCDPWPCVRAGLHVAPRYYLPDGRTVAPGGSASPWMAARGVPALAWFYIGTGGAAVGLRFRAMLGAAELARHTDRHGKPLPKSVSLRDNGPRLPWGADALAGLTGAETLHVAEGEPDALALRLHGVRAIGTPGASTVPGDSRAAWLTRAGRARRVLVWYDPDAGGDKGAATLQAALRAANGWTAAETRRRVRRVTVGGVGPGKVDVNDLHARGALASVLARLEETA